jgi:acyl phosphate:glycerol-3-phosphate acyltransferase
VFTALAAGYLIGSIPVAVVVGRRSGVDLRTVGDRNPGYWNARAHLDRRASLAVFVLDVAKGAAAAGLGRWLGDEWWVGYVAAGAAMIGHAWPLFAGFRGGRSVLTFVGAMVVLSPVAAAMAVVACVVVTVATRRFAIGARVGVFGLPLLQLIVDPISHVAATGALMTIIGIRFGQAARASRDTSDPSTGEPGEAPPR